MIWLIRALVASFVALLQATFLATLFGRLPIPNLILVATVTAGLQRKWTESLIWASVGGLTLDFFTSGRGFYTLTLVCLATGLKLLFDRRTNRPPLLMIAPIIGLSSIILPTVELVMAGGNLTWHFWAAIGANLIGIAFADTIVYLRRKPYGPFT